MLLETIRKLPETIRKTPLSLVSVRLVRKPNLKSGGGFDTVD